MKSIFQKRLRIAVFIQTLSLVLTALFLCYAENLPAAERSVSYSEVRQRLVADGLTASEVERAFALAPAPLFKVVAKAFHIQEGKLNYAQFLEPAVIAKASDFLKDYESTLVNAEAAYKVDRTVIVAILLVETQLGKYTGSTSTLGVLSTFALMDQKKYRDKIWAMLSESDRTRWGREGFERKMESRAKWAYSELLALLKWSNQHGTKPASYSGSVMGAVGWPQFLPSSMIRFAQDGNKDGRVDLYQPADAIFSIANYLKGNGWCEAKTRADREQVIWQYNHSTPYISAVLGVAERLQ